MSGPSDPVHGHVLVASSSYTLAFDEPSALSAGLFPARSSMSQCCQSRTIPRRISPRHETSLTGVQCVELDGMVHSEQMLSLGTSAKTIETLRIGGRRSAGIFGQQIRRHCHPRHWRFRVVWDVQRRRKVSEPRIEVAYVAKLDPASKCAVAVHRTEPKNGRATTSI